MGESTKKLDFIDRFITIDDGPFLATRTFHIADQPGLESISFGDLLIKGTEH